MTIPDEVLDVMFEAERWGDDPLAAAQAVFPNICVEELRSVLPFNDQMRDACYARRRFFVDALLQNILDPPANDNGGAQ